MITVEELLQRKGIIDAHTGEKEKVLRINSLKDAGFEDGEIKIRSLSKERMNEINKLAVKNPQQATIEAVYEGVIEPKLSNDELQKAYNCFSPFDIVEKIFTPIEADRIASQINIISGYAEGDKKIIEEIKNS